MNTDRIKKESKNNLLIIEKNQLINYKQFLIKKKNKLNKSHFYFNNLTEIINNVKLTKKLY